MKKVNEATEKNTLVISSRLYVLLSPFNESLNLPRRECVRNLDQRVQKVMSQRSAGAHSISKHYRRSLVL